jgi:maleate isomerase
MRPDRRLGLIVPSSNTMVEHDFGSRLPGWVGMHVARMHLAHTTPGAERTMLRVHVKQAADDLATLHPHVVAFACTSAGALLGVDGELELERDLARRTGASVVSTNAAVAAALRRLGARRVAVMTAYVDALNHVIEETLATRGFEVVQIEGLALTDNFAIAEVGVDELVAFVHDRIRPGADALFVSCTNLAAADAQEAIAAEVNLPVVTSNMATLELAMELLEEADPIVDVAS